MTSLRCTLLGFGLGLLGACSPGPGAATDEAIRIAHAHILVDTHIDVPYRLQEGWEDVTAATANGDFDYPRARNGGLDVIFMSIYTPSELDRKGGHWQLANELIDSVEAIAARAPDRFRLVRTATEAEQAFADGQVALAMGMENGSPIGDDLANVGFFYDRGVRYITLAHAKSNNIADSSYDKERPNAGLSAFGEEVVHEMNRLGMIIDASHLSDDAIRDILQVSNAPLVATHSSARHFTPGWERNLSDELIQAIAEKGGVVAINFGSSFLTKAANDWYEHFDAARDEFKAAQGDDEALVEAWTKQYRETTPFPHASIDDVADHIEYVMKLVGPGHVGLGSDFDGVGDSLPIGLKSVADYPALVAALQARGHDEATIAGILGANTMRAWHAVEAAAATEK